jgi:predicted permease
MGWTDLVLRLRALVRYGRAESELDEELRFHMEMEARKQRVNGLVDEEARRSARVRFGGVEQVREECRDVRGLTLIENLARDVRYGARMLRKTPGFTAIAVLSLAIGIGANTAVFSLVDAVMLRMLPVRNPEQLVVVKWGAHADLSLNSTWAEGGDDGHGGWTNNVFSWAVFSELRARSRTVTDVIGFSPLGPVSVVANGQALPAGAMVISGNYFPALGVETVIGRPIADDDDAAGGLPSAVITYRLWDRVFGRDPSAIGKTLYINRQPCTIVGVTPKNFFGVSAGGFIGTPQVDIMLPIRFRDRMQVVGQKPLAWFVDEMCWIQVMGRLKPGRDAAAKSELAAMVKANLPDKARSQLGSETPRVYLDPGGQGLDSLRLACKEPLLILMAVVGLTLLMACTNLAGLLMARATARQREIMLRLAVGASRGRLVRQLLVEGAVLSAAGAIAALAVAWWGVRALLAMAASRSAPIPPVTPDARVFVFTAAVSLAATFLFALAPALRATHVDVAAGLKQDTGPALRFGSGSILVALQVAVALVLLVGATLFTRSLVNLQSLPLGFNPHKLVLFDIAPGENGYDETRGNQLYERVRERLNQSPGVIGATLSANRLISGWVSNGPILPDGAPDRKNVQAYWNLVGPDFFEVMKIPVVAGRGIEPRDMGATPRIAVMNESLARQCFGGELPVGRRFRWSWKKDWDVEVIGVVKDAKFDRLRGDAPPTFYLPYTQAPFGFQPQMSFEVRMAGDTADAAAAIRRAVAGIDRTLPVMNVNTQEMQIDDSLAQEHAFATLVSLFSAITLALACVGLYGAVAYTVTRRTRELGVRMALGANRIAVLRMLLGQVALTVAAGLALGLPATWMLTRIVESQLYGIKPHDPASITLACAGVAGVAMIAAFLPARRAMRIDPVRALRYE